MATRQFVREAIYQCDVALIAMEDLKRTVQVQFRGERIDNRRVWAYLQDFVVATGTLSLLFWGRARDAGAKADRADLRAAVGLGDSSPLADRRYRHDLQHVDDRIVAWARDSKRHNMIDRNITNQPPPPRIEKIDTFRHLNQTTMTLTFQENEYPVLVMLAEVERIYPLLVELDGRRPTSSSPPPPPAQE